MDHEALLQKVSDGLDDLYADTSVSDGQLYEELTGLFDTIGDMLSELEDTIDRHPQVDEGDEPPDVREAQWAPRGP